MVVKRIGLLVVLLAMVALVASACTESKPATTATAPTAPASGGTTPAAAAKLPVAALTILPVPANASDPNVVKASLPGTTTTVAMGMSGEGNLSVGVPVTLKGGTTDPAAPAKKYTWTLAGPSASKASFSSKDAEITKFTPDVPGIYKVDLVVANDGGNSVMASEQIQAATFVGVDKGNCKNCHADKASEWTKTLHATKLSREINGGSNPKNTHYSESCVRCHSVGYNIGVANGGFADVQAKLGWKFPPLTALQSGADNWSAVPADLKNLGNIQCENCHGPASAHLASKAPMAVSLDEGVCNVCHNGGGTHVKGALFENSAHSEANAQAWTYPTGPARQACVRCHSGKGFISFLENPTEQASWNNEPQTVTCGVCHDPHSEDNALQLRIVGKAVMANGVTKDFGLSAVCVECHNGRTQAADAVKGSTPHYSAAAEMLSNSGGVDYGQKLVDSPHGLVVGASPVSNPTDATGAAKLFKGETPGSCVACHMWPTPADTKDANRFKVGDHSFNVVSPDGTYQYTASCQQCHKGITDFNFPAKADYDGNGKVEGVQAEVAGLLKVLQTAIGDSGIKPVEGHPYFDATAKAKANDKQNNAIFNYLFVRGLDGSDGKAAAIHNFKRSIELLQLSYKDLTGKDVPGATLVK